MIGTGALTRSSVSPEASTRSPASGATPPASWPAEATSPGPRSTGATRRVAGRRATRLPAGVGRQKLFERRRGERPAEQEALGRLAAERPQPLQLVGRLHALGDHLQADAAGQAGDGGHHRRVLGARPEAGDEAAIDLDQVEGESLEV